MLVKNIEYLCIYVCVALYRTVYGFSIILHWNSPWLCHIESSNHLITVLFKCWEFFFIILWQCLMPETVELQIEEVSEAALVERIRLRKVKAAVDMYDQLVQAGRRISQNRIPHNTPPHFILLDRKAQDLCEPEQNFLPKHSPDTWLWNFSQAQPCHWIWPTTCWIWFVCTEIGIHCEKTPQNRELTLW